MWSNCFETSQLTSSDIDSLSNHHVQYKQETGKACCLVKTIHFTTRGATMHPLPLAHHHQQSNTRIDLQDSTRRGLRYASDTVQTNPFLQGRSALPSPSPHPSLCHSRQLISNFSRPLFRERELHVFDINDW